MVIIQGKEAGKSASIPNHYDTKKNRMQHASCSFYVDCLMTIPYILSISAVVTPVSS